MNIGGAGFDQPQRRSAKRWSRRIAIALGASTIALSACEPSIISREKRAAESAVRERLRDPQSAQFEDVQVSIIGDYTRVCGTVNAKNAFGGYTGRKRFAYLDGVLRLEEDFEGPGHEYFEAIWSLCPRK